MTNRNTKNVWLYSANYDGWWLYDQKSTIKLNRIWHDYIMRNNLIEENDQFSINATTSSKSLDSHSSAQPKCSTKKIFQISCDHVSYDVDMVDEIDNDVDKQEKYITYIIEAGDNRYYIDLDRMKQINCANASKQRTIKRIEIPKKISEKNVIQYLINEHKLNIKIKS